MATSTFEVATLALLLFGGCESVVIIDSSGDILVAISTHGPVLDPGGYSLIVDGDKVYAVPAAGSLVLQLEQGSHSVRLSGLAANCVVDSANPRSVEAGPGGLAQVSFSVVCGSAPGRGG